MRDILVRPLTGTNIAEVVDLLIAQRDPPVLRTKTSLSNYTWQK
jgi:hypothetical protein